MNEHRLVLMPDLTAGCCALTALAASASAISVFAFTLCCQLGYFSWSRSTVVNSFLRVNNFPLMDLVNASLISVVLISFCNSANTAFQFSARSSQASWLRSDLALVRELGADCSLNARRFRQSLLLGRLWNLCVLQRLFSWRVHIFFQRR